jgi:hypothetical protein
MAAKKFIVELDRQERARLHAPISKGKSTAKAILKARLLLKADQAEGGAGWLDAQIVEALDTNPTMVLRVRETFVTKGLDAVLTRNKARNPAHSSDFRRRSYVADPDLSGFVLPGENLHRQVDPYVWIRLHQRRAELRIAKNQDLSWRKLHAGCLRASGMIHRGNDLYPATLKCGGQPINRFLHTKHALKCYEQVSSRRCA